MKQVRCVFLVLISFSTGVFAKNDVLIKTTPAVTSMATAQQEVKIGVKGMVCAFCAQGIEKKFKSFDEVSAVEVSLENKYVKIKYKDGKSLPKDKITEILKDSGYEATFEN